MCCFCCWKVPLIFLVLISYPLYIKNIHCRSKIPIFSSDHVRTTTQKELRKFADMNWATASAEQKQAIANDYKLSCIGLDIHVFFISMLVTDVGDASPTFGGHELALKSWKIKNLDFGIFKFACSRIVLCSRTDSVLVKSWILLSSNGKWIFHCERISETFE